MDKLDMKSKNIVEQNILKLGELFPEIVKNNGDNLTVDFDMLKQELSEIIIDDKKEKYELNWPGKKESLVLANTTSTDTLRPLVDTSLNFENTQNIYIEGDNLDALKILQESYLNKIKCIYIDPPYNTGNDFVYNDKFEKNSSQELLESGQIDEDGNRLVTNLQSNGKFHSNWLSMIYPRLKLARNLLMDDGVIFISIDDNEQANLEKICNEVFGENSFVTKFVWKKTENIKMDSKYVSVNSEYILCYKKGGLLEFKKELSDVERYNLEDEKGKYYLRKLDSKSSSYSKGMDYVIEYDGVKYYAGGDYNKYLERQNGGAKRKDCTWLWSKEKYQWGLDNNEIVFKNGNVYNKVRYDGEAKKPYTNIIDFVSVQTAQKELDDLMGERIFDHPKPVSLIKYLINLVCNDNDIVLDFFSGSSTSAHAVMEYNSENNANIKYICVQYPETIKFVSKYNNICEVGEERIRRAGRLINKNNNSNIDYGFRIFKIDSSNMKDDFYKIPGELEQSQLRLFETNIKEDRSADDLLTGVILDLGLTLDYKVEEKNIKGNKIYYVNGNELVACFDESVDINFIDEVSKIEPLMAVFRDDSFKTDSDKINLEERFKKLSPNTKISIL